MLTYKITARDPKTGEKISTEVDAENEQSAAKVVRTQGLAPLDITLKGSSGDNLFSKFLNKVRAKERILFARQLATLINAGLPLVQSLRSVADQTQSKQLRVIANKIIADVEAGGTLSGALAKHPDVFNQIFVNLVAAGETSGTLDKALERIAFQQEKDAEIMAKVKGALAYPVIVLFVMIGVVGFMIVKVLPQVESIYKGIPGTKLPFITVALLAISHFVISFWWVVILAIIGAAFVTSKWARTGPGKIVIDKMKMKMWPIGPLFMKLYMARFARTATTLIASGVPLLQVLDIVGNAVNNVHIRDSLIKASEKVRGGKALSTAIEGDPNFLPLVPNMLKIGEQSGAIEQMTQKVAEYYETEVDNQIKTISTIIEPVMMVLLGVVAFIIVAAILLPIYGLANQTQNIR